MTTVVTYDNIPLSSPADTALYFLDQTKLALQKQTVSQDGLTTTAVYKYAYGDPASNTRVIVTRRDDPSQGLVHCTVRLETRQTVVVDSVETESQVAACTVGISMPGAMEDTAKTLTFLGSAFSLFFDGVTSKVPNAGIIGKMNFGVIADLY
jgi:hypothetical protein